MRFPKSCVFATGAHNFEKSTSSFGTRFFCNVHDKCRYRLIERFSNIKIGFIFTAYNDKRKYGNSVFLDLRSQFRKKSE